MVTTKTINAYFFGYTGHPISGDEIVWPLAVPYIRGLLDYSTVHGLQMVSHRDTIKRVPPVAHFKTSEYFVGRRE